MKLSTNLNLVTHRTFASHHDLAASVHLELLGSHATRTENSSNKVELNTSHTVHNLLLVTDIRRITNANSRALKKSINYMAALQKSR